MSCTQAVIWAIVLTSFVWLMMLVASAGDGDLDCSDMQNRATAQAIFDSDKSDPYDLDRDGDSLACENLP